MFDDDDEMLDTPGLLDVLRHYGQLAEPDRHIWQDRLMEHPEVDARGLTGLHGELLASGWIEQNTGHTVPGRAGVAACYRITTAGLRMLREL